MYFLCPISIVRYDYTDLFLVSSIPQAMIFFDFFVVILVGFRCFFSLHAPPSMCERPKKSRSAPKWPYVFPFSGGKNVPKKRKSWDCFFVLLGITLAWRQIVPGLREGLLIVLDHPFQRSCPLPRRNPRVLHTKNTFIPKTNLKQSIIIIPKYSQNLRPFEPIILIM